MTTVMTILMSLSMVISGIYAQLDFIVRPAKYNAQTVKTSDVPDPVSTSPEERFIQLSETNMHYFVYDGGGRPLILIHGNGGTADSLKQAAEYFANDYTVYVPESRCHGRSSDPGEISYELMAKDYAEFIQALGLDKPIIVGHSDGGINAITLAAKYPELPGAIIACGANSEPKMLKPYFPLFVGARNVVKPDKLNEMMLTLPDFTPEYLSTITCPAYIIGGQLDIVWISDTKYIADNIPGADFTILIGENHSSYISQNGRKIYALSRPWLTEKGL